MHNYLPLRLVSSYVRSGCILFITIPAMHLSAQVFVFYFRCIMEIAGKLRYGEYMIR